VTALERVFSPNAKPVIWLTDSMETDAAALVSAPTQPLAS